jgi:F-type H+-transporting ATPase subunit a
MVFASGFSWFHLLPIVDHDALLPFMEHDYLVVHAWLVCLVLVGFAVAGRMALEAAKRRDGLKAYEADDRLNVRTLAELVVDMVRGFMGGMLEPKDVRFFFPLVSALFVYIFCCNILSVVPGFQPPTDDISANFGMALIVFGTFNFFGFVRDPIGYLKHLWGPVPLLGLLLFPIEVFSISLRPVTLAFRLAVNMYADHLVYGIMNDLVSFMAFPLMFLAILVSLVQAFVFSLLTTVYLHLSLPHGHHDDHGSHGDDGHASAH